MRKTIFIIPFLLFGSSLMHPDDPKSRNHNSLGFGVSGDLKISNGVFYISQTASSLNNGSVYIYTPNTKNHYDKDIILAPIDDELGFDFGYSLDVYKDFMIIGPPHRANITGRAYLYKKNSKGNWQLIKIIKPTDHTWTADFGSKVVINDHHILISDRMSNDEKGAVFTMKKDVQAGNWENGSVLIYENMIDHGLLGHSIGLYNDNVVIGSRNGNVAIEYEYDSTNSIWLQKNVFTSIKYQSKGRYGFSIDISSKYLVIGSPGFNEHGFVDIFYRSNNDWERLASISNPENINESYFGSALSIYEDNILIGNYNGEKSHIYQISNLSPKLIKSLIPPQNIAFGKFGRSLDMINDQILVGATYAEEAYLYELNSDNNWGFVNSLSSNQRSHSIKGKKTPCVNGKSGSFNCNDIDMLSFIAPKDLTGGTITELNDLWGWIDSTTGKEYALVGLRNGTSFVDISDPINPNVLGFLPTATTSSIWRDIKVYKDHAYIVADNVSEHGVQIFDLTQLRDISSFTSFKETANYDLVHSVHNIAINEETGFAYAVGISSASKDEYKCGAHIIDINDPSNPTYAGCLGDKTTGRYNDGYIHDGQFVVYKGPDKDYYGKEIAFTCNETALGIADITDKSNIKIISKYDEKDFGYVHQGWLSEDHRYFFVNDELNEYYGPDIEQTTVIFDLEDLDNPKIHKIYRSGLSTIDHNNYVKGNLLYQSNYSSGLRVLFLNDINNPVEIAHFDTYASGDKIDFVGSWSNYPFFKSGTIAVSSIEEGLFLLKASKGGSLSIKKDYIPDNFELKQNYPNPFNPVTQVEYTIPYKMDISLTLFNALGVEVKKIDQGYRYPGTHIVNIDGRNLPTGIYFYQLRAGDFIETKKMSLIK